MTKKILFFSIFFFLLALPVHAEQKPFIIPPSPPIDTSTFLTTAGAGVDYALPDTIYFPTLITFGQDAQEYDIDGNTWVTSTAGTTLGCDVAGHLTAACIAAVTTPYDASYLNIRENAGAGTFTAIFTFTGVTSFHEIEARSYYQGGAAHIINIDLYNNDTLAWDTFHVFSGESGYTLHDVAVLADADYISGGTVLMRYIHTGTGVNTHSIQFDYVSLVDNGGSGGGQVPEATAIKFVPAGSVAAVNVQTAIEEVDSEKLAVAGTDIIKDTHIDWGAGAGQVDYSDIPDGCTGSTTYRDCDGNADDISTVYVSLSAMANNVITCTTGDVLGTNCGSGANFTLGPIIQIASGTVELPAVSTGYRFCFKATTAAAINIDANASDRIILDGVALDDGDKLTSTGAIDDTICLYADSASGYTTVQNPSGFSDGGP